MASFLSSWRMTRDGFVLGTLGAVVWACFRRAVMPAPAASPTQAPVAASDVNANGWPKSIATLSIGFIPLEDQVQQRAKFKPFIDYPSRSCGR
jgi:ABC-type phosphate/phosphonate transport system substrate-binding protein